MADANAIILDLIINLFAGAIIAILTWLIARAFYRLRERQSNIANLHVLHADLRSLGNTCEFCKNLLRGTVVKTIDRHQMFNAMREEAKVALETLYKITLPFDEWRDVNRLLTDQFYVLMLFHADKSDSELADYLESLQMQLSSLSEQVLKVHDKLKKDP